MSLTEIDQNLIHEFRNKVNEDPIFRELYKDINGKNKWNVICSAMDWITVTSEGLSSIRINNSVGIGYNNIETLNLMQYIICVDILVESIRQLYRVLFDTNTYPLIDDREVFNQSKISDDKYFKHVRAVFSTHPINLNSLDGIKSHNGERFYASWVSRDSLGENDFNVFLYSNKPLEDEYNYFGIRINDINRYAEKRYALLVPLMGKVELILSNHKYYYMNISIPMNENIVEELKILLKENNIRFGLNYGYADTISYILRMMQIELKIYNDFDYSILKEYRDSLITLIPIIRTGLQNMNGNALTWEYTCEGYEFEKIYSYLNDDQHPIGKEYFNKLVYKGILPLYILNYDNSDEKRLLLDAILYKEYKKRSKRVIYKELIEHHIPGQSHLKEL